MAVISKIDRAVTCIWEAMVHIPVVVALLIKLLMICSIFPNEYWDVFYLLVLRLRQHIRQKCSYLSTKL
jgi:hypothetical protein